MGENAERIRKDGTGRICLYHRVMRRENFEKAAQDLFSLLVEAQKRYPNRERVLYVDIDGHRNKKGGFDHDMLELQKDFGLGFLLQFFCEVYFPLAGVKNSKKQENEIPEKLEILNAQNNQNRDLENLYIENYDNTEFISEPEIYDYMMHLSEFLKQYYKDNLSYSCEELRAFDQAGLIHAWFQYMKDMIIELYNDFIHGNLISATAMTRTMMECYVYVGILKKERSRELLEDWFICNLFEKAKSASHGTQAKVLDHIKEFSRICNRNYDELCQKFYRKEKERWVTHENEWLREVIKPKNGRVSFRGACEYMGEGDVYEDFQKFSSFVHGQDIASKFSTFTFYSSICDKLFIMVLYIFNVIRLFGVEDETEEKMRNLENELLNICKKILQGEKTD